MNVDSNVTATSLCMGNSNLDSAQNLMQNLQQMSPLPLYFIKQCYQGIKGRGCSFGVTQKVIYVYAGVIL